MELLILFDIIWRRLWLFLLVFCSFFAVVAVGSFVATPVYKAKTVILLQSSDAFSNLMGVLNIRQQGQSRQAEKPFAKDAVLATARPVADQVIDQLGLKNKDDERLDADDFTDTGLLNVFKAGPFVEAELDDDADDLLGLVCSSPDPEFAARICNAMGDAFLRYRGRLMLQDYKKASEYVAQRIDQVRVQYYQAQAALVAYQREHSAVDLNFESQGLITKVQNAKTAVRENETVIANMEAEARSARQDLAIVNKFRDETIDLRKSENLNELVSKLNDLFVSLTARRVELTESHPDILQLKEQINQVKELIGDNTGLTKEGVRQAINPLHDFLQERLATLRMNLRGALAKREALAASVDLAMAELIEMPQKVADSSKLSQTSSMYRELYESLMEHQARLKLIEQSPLSDGAVVEAAAPPEDQSFPDKKLNFILGFILAIFFALAAVLFVEYIAVARQEQQRKNASPAGTETAQP